MTTEKQKTVVLKFGSSVLTCEEDLPIIVHEVYREWRPGTRVLVVVSAIGNNTNDLLQRAHSVSQEPDETALATLLATGELSSAAMLSLALTKAGIPTRLLDPVQAGLQTRGSILDAELISANKKRLLSEIESSVVVLPGFIGRNSEGKTTLLGRGGSDFSALFLADLLNAECVLLKDVNGLYTCDPASKSAAAERYAEASYDTVCRVGSQVVQPKAVGFAAGKGQRFTIRTVGACDGTVIGPFRDRIAENLPKRSPLKVAVLGRGTVGGGVIEHLSKLKERFTLVGVGIRDSEKPGPINVGSALVTTDLETLIDSPCDVVVELIGGVDRAYQLVKRALNNRRHVITANKALLATHGAELRRIAHDRGVQLSYSAAVGGALPAIEAAVATGERGRITRLSGVLNGTTNFILDQLADGVTFAEALEASKQAGYAEADPTLDLNGTDAAQKLILLADAALGIRLDLKSIRRTGIERVDSDFLKRARKNNKQVRLVASLDHSAAGTTASVEPVELPHGHPLASASGSENRLLIELAGGETYCISGKGAGRWPTSGAVIADLMELYRQFDPETEYQEDELEECVA